MFFSARENAVLRELSENSRISLSSMAKQLDCSYVTVGKAVDKLGEKLGIRFTLELDPTKLGILQRRMLMIKFRKKPPLDWLEQVFVDQKNINSAYLAEGQFDVVVFVTESDPIRYAVWENRLKQNLSDYGAIVSSSELPYFSFGYMAVDDYFIDSIATTLKRKEKELLKLLNANSRASYSELARRLGLTEPTIRYKVFNLVKRGVIKRFTIAVQKPPQDYMIGIFERWISCTKRFEERAALSRKYRMNFDEQVPTLTTFQMSAPLIGTWGNFILGLFDSKVDALNVVEKQKEIYAGESYEERHSRIIRPIKGLFTLRNINIKENYNVVKWQ
jgi:DNA-binding Lrp family transcriptional regulator